MAIPATVPPPKVSLIEQIASVIREIGMRKRVYPGWVGKGKMKQDQADHELAAMENVLVTVRDYQAMQPKVLALSAVCLALGQSAGMSDEALSIMLARAEETAKAELEQAARTVLVIDDGTSRPWPFPLGKQP